MKDSLTEPLDDIGALPQVGRTPSLVYSNHDDGVHPSLVQNIVTLRSVRERGSVYAFTSARRREGVSYVVGALGNQVGGYTGGKILVISFDELSGLTTYSAKQIEDRVPQHTAPRLWLMNRTQTEKRAAASLRVDPDVLHALRSQFSYIFIDCPAVEAGSQVFSLGNEIDGTVLVIRAGFSQKPEIQHAARLLGRGCVPLLGCILNRRTYPIPEAIFRLL